MSVSIAEPQAVTELDLACQAVREHQAQEKAARAARIAAEKVVIELIGLKEEGSQSAKTAYFKATTTGKLSRTLDEAAFMAMREQIPDNIAPVTYHAKLDLKKLRALEQANPDAYALMAKCITTKPAKPAVKVEMLRHH